MSVAFAPSPRSIGLVSRSRSNAASRDQSATYGDGAHCAWSPPSRSIASTTPPFSRRRSICRARSARLSSRRVSTGARGGIVEAYGARRRVLLLGEPADHADHLSLDLDVARVDRGHLSVRRLQSDAVLFLVEALQRGGVVLEKGHDDVPVARGVLLLDDHVVAVVDVIVDHRLPAHAEDVRLAAARRH